ncbi:MULTISPECIES: arylamine N-acetyltransferase family protein [Halorussus]|uniref:arylamine N-acetyltransferase family protein n=1 Tax=Halorussus TaxID=1070314 RepID=UPI0020A1141B|nr:arylamine N-acetyltransferase [Halorussus vallis]USZ74149.1 arylamine N-acetyltransferase [Halorussus vallis]
MDVSAYLARLGLDPADVRPPNLRALERLQRAHVATVPFETLAITGDPFDRRDGEGVSLSRADLYDKLVERERGGFCYELNGLFGWFLGELGFDVERRAAMVLSDDGARPPANHLTHVVSLDRQYVADVGLGVPTMRRPVALDGDATDPDAAGVAWRVAESDRPDVDFAAEYRESGGDWTTRYVFRDVPRETSYFEATCEWLATAPESPFTGDPVVSLATERGHRKLSPGALTHRTAADERERSLDEAEYYDALEREFGIDYRPR